MCLDGVFDLPPLLVNNQQISPSSGQNRNKLTFCRLGRQPGWDQDPKVQPEQKWQWWAIEIVLKWIWLRAGKQKVKMVEIDTWCVCCLLFLSPSCPTLRLNHDWQAEATRECITTTSDMFTRQKNRCLIDNIIIVYYSLLDSYSAISLTYLVGS